ncbi:hypothetical protein PBRA_001679 [Plasmodiophora brassicae]|nr:hypothetical protein PBRA_001679 [Plasmodiophora brassicae]
MRAAGIGSGDSVVVCLGKPLPRALVRPTTTTKRSKKASDDVLDPFTPQPRLVDRMRQIIAKRQLLSDIPPDLQRLLRSVDVQEADVVSSADLHHIDPQHEYVAQLQRMGFSYSASVKALIVNMYDIERALNWLLEHSSDPDLHVPLSDVSLRRLSESDADRRDDDSRILASP